MRRFNWKWIGAAVVAVGSMSPLAEATRMRSVLLSSEDKILAPRWMYEKSEKVESPAIVAQLVAIRKAQLNNQFLKCISLIKKTSDKGKGLLPWLSLIRLECSSQKGVKLSDLNQSIAVVEAHPEWLIWGAQAARLKAAYSEALLTALELHSRSDKKSAWRYFDRLQQMGQSLSAQQRAKAYKIAGELAFIEQNVPLALDFFTRSLSQQEASEVRKRLEALKASGAGKKSESSPVPAATDPSAEMVADEKSLYLRAKQAYESGDLLSAVEDAMKMLRQFPGGLGAQWSNDKVLEIYLNIASKGEDYESLRRRTVELMQKADADRLYRWGLNAQVRGQYTDAFHLGRACVEAYGGQSEVLRALSLTAHSALHSGQTEKAEDFYLRIANGFSGTDEAKQAWIRLGLLKYRAKKFSDASAFFERVLALPTVGDWEYTALYWHWRSQQALKAPTAVLLAERLVQRYPLTYYGLRARAELNGGVLSLNKAPSLPIKAEMWLSESQSQAWEKFLILLQAGWFEEAQQELQQLPEPQTVEDKVIRARLLAAAFDHYNAIRTFNGVWTERPELLHVGLVRAAFPGEFKSYIDKLASSAGLDSSLVSGVIRQESSFRAEVISPSNAFGLMQVLPSTGKEVAARWKPQPKFPDDLKDPEVNLRIGSVYLSRLIRAFKGHVPLALAAYNAGIGRIRRWQSSRKDLAELDVQATSAPESEMWIDELPWDETSLYVKAVLRNILIYRILDKGEVRLEDPVWKMLKL